VTYIPSIENIVNVSNKDPQVTQALLVLLDLLCQLMLACINFLLARMRNLSKTLDAKNTLQNPCR